MTAHHPLLEELIKRRAVTIDQAAAIQNEHLAQGESIRNLIIKQNYLDEPAYLTEVARLLNTYGIDLSATPPAPALAEAIPAHIARMQAVAPVSINERSVVLAVSDWPSPAATDEIAFMLSREVEYVVAPQEQINAVILELYGEERDSTHRSAQLDEIEQAANTTPVIRFVNRVLDQAVKDRASDIHFEPFEHEFKIRYRVDGALFEMEPPPKNLALPMISRVKVIAGLDIAESRLPQDGRIQLTVDGRSIDFRVSTLPTQFGESVVLRVLDRSNTQLDIEKIGLPAGLRESVLEDIQKPNGIVIATGPTGSGKTTTLYAALQHINNTETKILTAEDPVEYDMDGIVQLPICDNIGLTFPAALRSFLRQDPDIIMVGEIRDSATAQISIQASLTGHLVFSTLHTNDAAGAITRLIDMDVEPYLIASTLEAVIGQRLVRTICPNCKTAYEPDDQILHLLELDRLPIKNQPFYRGEGCNACSHSGYTGRRAIFEYLRINDDLRAEIIKKQPTLTLRNKAIEHGMHTLREDGIRCILQGCTTVEEVVKHT